MVKSLSRPEKESYLLVEFRFGDPAVPIFQRYTDWGQSVTNYPSEPTMEVSLSANTATFDQQESRIILPLDSFTDRISDGLPHSPTFVRVDEVTLGLTAGDQGSFRTLLRGRVVRFVRDFQGRNDSVALFVLSAKARLDVPLGLQCNHHDEFRLFGPGSGLSQATFQRTGQIAAIDGKEVTISTPNLLITAPTSPGGNVDRYWERGFLEKDGLKIGVHIWKLTDPTKFVLRRRPPSDWLLAGAASILFVPGSHKTIEDARAVWANEANFGGFGYAMPAYHPIFESPE